MPVVKIPLGPSWLYAGVPAITSRTNSGKEISNEKIMSTNNPIDLRQDRRQWLKTSASILGGSWMPINAVCEETLQTEAKAAAAATSKVAETKSSVRFFTPAQHALVEELSETIIPADDHSGGAKAAKVADTIDEFLREDYGDSKRTLWREGLRLIDLMSQHYCGKTFVN